MLLYDVLHAADLDWLREWNDPRVQCIGALLGPSRCPGFGFAFLITVQTYHELQEIQVLRKQQAPVSVMEGVRVTEGSYVWCASFTQPVVFIYDCAVRRVPGGKEDEKDEEREIKVVREMLTETQNFTLAHTLRLETGIKFIHYHPPSGVWVVHGATVCLYHPVTLRLLVTWEPTTSSIRSIQSHSTYVWICDNGGGLTIWDVKVPRCQRGS